MMTCQIKYEFVKLKFFQAKNICSICELINTNQGKVIKIILHTCFEAINDKDNLFSVVTF